ncbi:hypothetical protein Sme01_46080 [Sphaerisporangium melleum]|uniref:Uncharacterized protein n=1 Tax=Sphaerisporangium melleum TaxID=321316 RepID=A0A917QZC4_9ACTN|nr:hypothetical protein [Sphaerisporangium melleum]GGK79759.1 hypothetical protein GCM10007964_23000 [Sphaerisporangium melleum]GII72132.1 hypothetical protein Sme01_46080 [Sphaerisporangium melleum]
MSEPSPPASSPDPFAQCPSGCVCGVRELVARAADTGRREAEDVDATEMRAMLSAVRSGFETICRDPRLPVRRHAASGAYSRAERQLNRLHLMLTANRLGQAAVRLADAQRAADASPRRSRWLRRVRWPVVIGVGLFDVWYFNQVFRYLTSQTGDADQVRVAAQASFAEQAGSGILDAWESLASIVPGVALAVIIAVTGELMLRPLATWRAAAFRRPVARPQSRSERVGARLAAFGRWALRLAWWLLPVCFLVMLLFVIGTWAGIRAVHPSGGYQPLPVIMLIVMLSLGAMTVKVAAADREAEDLAAARRRLWWMNRAYLLQSRKADRLIGAYDSSWSDLRTLRDELIGLLRLKMISAWEGFILRIRSLHRQTGNVTVAEAGTVADRALTGPEFEGVVQPRMEAGPLLEVCRLVEERHPDQLRERKRLLDEAYGRQLTATRAPVAVLPSPVHPPHVILPPS